MNDLPEKIKAQFDAVLFCDWLERHPEITGIQGYAVERDIRGRNKVTGFVAGSTRIPMDINRLWGERRMFNDWIDSYRARHGAR